MTKIQKRMYALHNGFLKDWVVKLSLVGVGEQEGARVKERQRERKEREAGEFCFLASRSKRQHHGPCHGLMHFRAVDWSLKEGSVYVSERVRVCVCA